MRQCMDITKVQARIKKIEGQLRAISEMVANSLPGAVYWLADKFFKY